MFSICNTYIYLGSKPGIIYLGNDTICTWDSSLGHQPENIYLTVLPAIICLRSLQYAPGIVTWAHFPEHNCKIYLRTFTWENLPEGNLQTCLRKFAWENLPGIYCLGAPNGCTQGVRLGIFEKTMWRQQFFTWDNYPGNIILRLITISTWCSCLRTFAWGKPSNLPEILAWEHLPGTHYLGEPNWFTQGVRLSFLKKKLLPNLPENVAWEYLPGIYCLGEPSGCTQGVRLLFEKHCQGNNSKGVPAWLIGASIVRHHFRVIIAFGHIRMAAHLKGFLGVHGLSNARLPVEIKITPVIIVLMAQTLL